MQIDVFTNFAACITDNVFTEWKIIKIRNAEGEISARHDSTTQDGSSKNVTTTAVITFQRKSSLLKSKVRNVIHILYLVRNNIMHMIIQ